MPNRPPPVFVLDEPKLNPPDPDVLEEDPKLNAPPEVGVLDPPKVLDPPDEPKRPPPVLGVLVVDAPNPPNVLVLPVLLVLPKRLLPPVFVVLELFPKSPPLDVLEEEPKVEGAADPPPKENEVEPVLEPKDEFAFDPKDEVVDPNEEPVDPKVLPAVEPNMLGGK